MAALSFERKRTAEHRYQLTFRYFSAPYFFPADENRERDTLRIRFNLLSAMNTFARPNTEEAFNAITKLDLTMYFVYLII